MEDDSKITFGTKSILDIMIAVAAAPSLPSSSTLDIIDILNADDTAMVEDIEHSLLWIEPEHGLVQHFIHPETLVSDASVVSWQRYYDIYQDYNDENDKWYVKSPCRGIPSFIKSSCNSALCRTFYTEHDFDFFISFPKSLEIFDHHYAEKCLVSFFKCQWSEAILSK